MNEKIREFLKQNIGYFIIAFVSVSYIMTAFLNINETGKSVAQILADGAISFFLGVLINRIFAFQGMMSGEQEECVQRIKSEHATLVLRISPHIEMLDDWCESENAKNYKQQRTKILARVGLKYADCFDEDGVAKDWSPIEENFKNKRLRRGEIKKVYGHKKAVNLHLTPLSAWDLTSEGGKQQDPFYFGRTKTQYETQGGIGDVVSKLCIAAIFGYYGVSLIENFDYSNLIWLTLQVGLFLTMGIIQMYQAHDFIKDEFRGRIVKKIDSLQKFENYAIAAAKREAAVEQSGTEKKTEEKENEHV